jgi:NAD(P)-dependent dehydrogenase (short-subunit alcohol dehydrogenase family)
MVTGGAQGIGRAVAERFVREGFMVLIADCDREAGTETERELTAIGEAVFSFCDVSEEEDVKKAVTRALNPHNRLDLLVCNAGIPFSGTPVTELGISEWRRILDVNLTGCFLAVKHAADHLRKTRGTIITVASTRAVQSEPHTEAYSASKGGIAALTHALAVSLGPEIRVNCISPGWIETSPWQKKKNRSSADARDKDHAQHPAGRVGRPEDIAALAYFLASDEASFVTGQNFVVDGGMVRKMIYAE